MTQEWNELKDYLKDLKGEGYKTQCNIQLILNEMEEIERRTLPERVAEALERIDLDVLQEEVSIVYAASTLLAAISSALRTGDTSELEKWQK